MDCASARRSALRDSCRRSGSTTATCSARKLSAGRLSASATSWVRIAQHGARGFHEGGRRLAVLLEDDVRGEALARFPAVERIVVAREEMEEVGLGIRVNDGHRG